MRVRLFVDFWNLQITWNQVHGRDGRRPRIPWEATLPEVLTKHANADGVYHGCHVYASVNPRSAADAGLRRFLHAMQGFVGYRVTVKERKPRGPYRCPDPACREPVRACPSCGGTLHRTVEKGVDTALVTDLIQAAIDELFDIAILVTADADFVPAVELVQNRTSRRVIHAHFRGRGQELRNACWSHGFLDDLMDELLA